MSEEKKTEYLAIPRELIEEKRNELKAALDTIEKFECKPAELKYVWAKGSIKAFDFVLSHSQPLSVFEQKAFEAGREKTFVSHDYGTTGACGGKDVLKYESFEDYKL